MSVPQVRPARAFGSDRLEPQPDGAWALVCRHPKRGWKARERAERQHRVDHPGTAILWGDGQWEVVSAERRADGGVRYVLAPWDPAQVFRTVERYEAGTEAERADERRRESVAASQRGALIVLAPLAGLLPEEDQLALERRLGVPAARMTFLSALPLLLFGVYCAVMTIASSLGGAPSLALAVLLAGDYLLLESFARLVVCVSQGRPVGSLLLLPWVLLKALRAPKKPDLSRAPDARDLREERDHTFHVLQPVLALLPDADQRVLAERFGFEAVSWGRTTARVLYGIGLLFAGSAVLNLLAGIRSPGELLWLVLGAALVLEQRGRLARLRAGAPSGSVFGLLIRPFARPLLHP